MFLFVIAFYLDSLIRLELPEFAPLSEPYTLTGLAVITIKAVAWRQGALRRRRQAP